MMDPKLQAQVHDDIKKLAEHVSHRNEGFWKHFWNLPFFNPFRIFWRDFRSVTNSAIPLICAVGLVIIPSLYAWFNIAGAWNVYNNTGSLKVAVANLDEGYRSDIVPTRIDVGEKLVSALRSNDQLGWTFTSRHDAVEGVRSGEYYAAIVIPQSFSRDMMTLFSPQIHHAKITYYTNAKQNPMAPIITGKGATTVRDQINQTFTKTMTSVALDVASAMSSALRTDEARTSLDSFVKNVDATASQARSLSGVIGAYSAVLSSAGDVVDAASAMLPNGGGAGDGAGDNSGSGTGLQDAARSAIDSASREAKAARNSARDASSAVKNALKQSDDAFANAQKAVTSLLDTVSTSSRTSASELSSLAERTDALAQSYASLSGKLTDLASQLHSRAGQLRDQANSSSSQPVSSALARAADRLDSTADRISSQAQALTRVHDSLSSSSAALKKAAESVTGRTDNLEKQKQEAKQALASARREITSAQNQASSQLTSATSSLAQIVSDASSTGLTLTGLMDQALNNAGQASEKMNGSLATTLDNLTDTQKRLGKLADELSSFSQSAREALNSGATDALKQLSSEEPETLAGLVSQPVGVERHAVFEVKTFGSQMTPLYGILAVWVGATLMSASTSGVVSERKKRGLRRLTKNQEFWGRYLSIVFMTELQALCLSLGCLFFLKVQYARMDLFILTFQIAAFVFSFFIYCMGAAFGVVGKAICVIVMIIQVSGSSGQYPTQLMPAFFGRVRPWLPATYAMDALRAAIAGVYNNDWLWNIGMLCLFLIPSALLGLVVREPLKKLMAGLTALSHRSHLMALGG
ncbi:YhgE/Pip domain-containing protein [Aeriscardovia aeriphila]|uniref:Phage infection protein n=1 Tax=Aeriscardovia aeriphila TaxID=218139 RepID=A0A261FCH0_9BIFI|nr:YhgE/Pip domain-containing protein [Aeriscardovia aeriphila]NYI26306.1 putative membrane protein [Aeriscardovia aeriphila]OZG56851.1 phage infection protein [Aeriscardovia aeriphila]